MADRVTEATSDLDEETLRRQFDPNFSPIGWHLGHIAWQKERWLLRDFGRQAPLEPRFDCLFDTFRSHKAARGTALPGATALHAYVQGVRAQVSALRQRHEGDPQLDALLRLAANHEEQHVEIVLTVRLLGGLYLGAAKSQKTDSARDADNSWVFVSGGRYRRGSPSPESGLLAADPDAWDNEHAAHDVSVHDFCMQRFPVSEEEWLAWMAEGGYQRCQYWSEQGWEWRAREGVTCPGNWERQSEGRPWLRRTLGGLVPVGGARPVSHVSWFEAQAYACSQGARLPSEAEWEYAASWSAVAGKRRFPWGDDFAENRADLGRSRGGPACRGAHPAGSSVWGIEDLCGGVWEWVADPFQPYPGFSAGWYAEYSAPWFGTRHRVARGGSWLTAPANARTTFRNWYEPRLRQPCLGVRLARSA